MMTPTRPNPCATRGHRRVSPTRHHRLRRASGITGGGEWRASVNKMGTVRQTTDMRVMMLAGQYQTLVEYEKLGRKAMLSLLTPDHYLPLLYVLAVSRQSDVITFPVEGVDGGAVSRCAYDHLVYCGRSGRAPHGICQRASPPYAAEGGGRLPWHWLSAGSQCLWTARHRPTHACAHD